MHTYVHEGRLRVGCGGTVHLHCINTCTLWHTCGLAWLEPTERSARVKGKGRTGQMEWHGTMHLCHPSIDITPDLCAWPGCLVRACVAGGCAPAVHRRRRPDAAAPGQPGVGLQPLPARARAAAAHAGGPRSAHGAGARARAQAAPREQPGLKHNLLLLLRSHASSRHPGFTS